MAPENTLYRLLAVLTWAAIASSQAPFTTPDSSIPDDPLLCNTSVNHANRSGVYPLSVAYPKRDGSTMPDPSWAITVTLRGGQKTRTSIWYDTAGERYDRDLEINYDVCAFIVSDLPRNTYLLGQKDPGDCSTTLTSTCADAINSKAASSALQWASYTGPNMTDGILPRICQKVAQDIREEMQRECKQEFGTSADRPTEGVSILDIALTGKNSTNLEASACDLTATSANQHFRRVTTQTQNSTFDAYYNATRSIYPILTVHMPVANAARESEPYTRANSSLQCVRARDSGEISEPVDPLPPGEPWAVEDNGDSGLRAGAKGGIAAGVVVVVLLVIGCAVWLYLRQGSRRHAKPLGSAPVGAEPNHEAKTLLGVECKKAVEASPAGNVAGKTSYDHGAQVDRAAMAELSGDVRPIEMNGDSRPVELGCV